MPGEHSLESTWALAAPLEAVWVALSDPERWPAWWPVVASVQPLKPGRADGSEAVYRLGGKVELRVCGVKPPESLEFHTETVLARWTLRFEGGTTLLHLSAWGCDDRERFAQAMSAGARGLARYLGVQLLEAGSWSAPNDRSIFP